MAFKRARRETFWLGIRDVHTIETTPAAAAETLLGMDSIEDRTATLIRVVGTITFAAVRSDLSPDPAPNTEGAELGFGLMCADGEAVAADPLEALSDERWIYTTRRQIHAIAHPYSFWNSQANAETIRYATIHAAPYPIAIDFDVRVARKFEEPCALLACYSWEDVGSLGSMASVTFQVTGRALFKAS